MADKENMAILPESCINKYNARSKRIHISNGAHKPRKMKICGFENLYTKINDFFKLLNETSMFSNYQPLTSKNKKEIEELINQSYISTYYSKKIFLRKNNYKKRPYREKIFLEYKYFDKNLKIHFIDILVIRSIEPRDIRYFAQSNNAYFDYPRYKNFPPTAHIPFEMEFRTKKPAI